MLRCANHHPNCTAVGLVVDANPDVAGIGVLISFLITSCLAVILGVIIMIFDMLRFYQGSQRKKHRQSDRIEPARSSHLRNHIWQSSSFWQEGVLRRNLLSLADTHLITGLAIQTAAIVKHCELSIYHFKLVAELAFLSTATHLLALVALRDYFITYRYTSIIRIGLMLINLALLGYVSYVAYSYELTGLSASHSLACFYQGTKPRLKAAFFGRWGAFLVGVILGHVWIIVDMYTTDGWSEDEGTTKRKCGWWSGFGHWAIALTYAGYGLSFAGFQLSNTQAMGKASVDINGSEKEWGFGQLLPVLLLVMPLLAAWESACEEYNKRDSKRRSDEVKGTSGGESEQMLLQESVETHEVTARVLLND